MFASRTCSAREIPEQKKRQVQQYQNQLTLIAENTMRIKFENKLNRSVNYQATTL